MRTLTPWFVKIWIFFLKKNPFLNFFSKMLNFPKKIVTQKCNKIVRQVVFQNCVSYKWGFFKYSIFGQIFDYYDNRTRLFGISNRLDSYSTIWYSSYSYSTKMVLAHSLAWACFWLTNKNILTSKSQLFRIFDAALTKNTEEWKIQIDISTTCKLSIHP